MGKTMIHTEITLAEQADRLPIRELVEVYEYCADRRDAEGQKSLVELSVRLLAKTAKVFDGMRPI
jgi:hypothetical protein